MFGYVNIDKESLSDGERGLYQTFMCGLCLSTKEHFKDSARLTVNYDINFYNVLFHSFCEIDVNILQERCIAHPLTKRTILQKTNITDRLAIANILLSYLNVYDDVVDGGSWKKRIVMSILKRDYQKATELMPELQQKLSDNYQKLRKLEQAKCDNLDQVCHPFATMACDVAKAVLGDKCNNIVSDLCYNVGKWIYLADALDDLNKDEKRGNYNPLSAYYKTSADKLVSENLEEINFVFFSVLNRIAQCYNDLNLTKYTCLLNNIIYKSIRNKTKQLINKYKQHNADKKE